MTVQIDGRTLTIRLQLQQDPPLSSSGKTRIVASTHGTVPTEVMYRGRRVSINVNAFVYSSRQIRSKD